jgi:hypothetical protein
MVSSALIEGLWLVACIRRGRDMELAKSPEETTSLLMLLRMWVQTVGFIPRRKGHCSKSLEKLCGIY